MVNLALAAVLAGIATYTDLKSMKIYNRHLAVFFILGLSSAAWQGQYVLLISAGLILALYLVFYSGARFMSGIAMSFGLMPIPEGKSPMGCGDVKLAAVLALLIGHFPVLYGTLAGVILLVIWQGLKLWLNTGSPAAMMDVALGRVHAPAPFGPFLGFCSVGAALAARYVMVG